MASHLSSSAPSPPSSWPYRNDSVVPYIPSISLFHYWSRESGSGSSPSSHLPSTSSVRGSSLCPRFHTLLSIVSSLCPPPPDPCSSLRASLSCCSSLPGTCLIRSSPPSDLPISRWVFLPPQSPLGACVGRDSGSSPPCPVPVYRWASPPLISSPPGPYMRTRMDVHRRMLRIDSQLAFAVVRKRRTIRDISVSVDRLGMKEDVFFTAYSLVDRCLQTVISSP
uniref:Uncharacterized protein n=1 Tax=Chromera velia CCMP2878 TaxID=1169474 RepID=A0A0G4GNK2_9ALVE|eukprot:Cvel_4973.t1-p1 / transcript=Cvel_4973.t1 / gene=Cvel_4973 / organism=Chromera_velia_CCMP2878 / gene_product=hypothetical protein / transcript_product=hypothetical protein / location=Cvel_scaffold225:10457-12279(+) / protein_length=222 / sequence_SO=supercontig / SO=protein_coding / is_pseudo=false